MERITITIESGEASKLRREAHRRRISLSELIREKIRGQALTGPASQRRSIPWAGVGASGNPKLATDLDLELDRTWADDLKRQTR